MVNAPHSEGERLTQRSGSTGVQYHRPKLMPIENFEHRPGGLDPADVFSAAQTVAAQLVTTGQDPNADADTVDWLIDLVDDVGLDTMAEMWANAPSVPFGGALLRRYALHHANNSDGERCAAWYRSGYDAYAPSLIAGVTEPLSARDLKHLVALLVRGVYCGDFAIALNRRGVYARVSAA